MQNDIDKKPIQLIRSEMKYLIFIILFVAGIIFNYLSITSKIDANTYIANSNTYRIKQVEIAREKAWAKYDVNCEKQTECLEKINKDIVKIKVKLGIED